MADERIYGFDKEDASRIAKTTPWVERQMNQGFSDYGAIKQDNPEILYARLTVQDAGGPGLWSATQVIKVDGIWTEPDFGFSWDGTDFEYCRHYSWSGATINQVVKMISEVADLSTGETVWTFDTDLGNPEVFQFYSDDNGSSSETNDIAAAWTMPVAGDVLTNVGTLPVVAPFTLNPGMMCVCLIRFVDYGEGLELASAELVERPKGDPGEYWETSSGGEIFVRVPIATADTAAGVVRLEQHHAGDIHIEMFGFASDDDDDDDDYTYPVKVEGVLPWIEVTKAGNTYTVSHRLPNHPANLGGSFKTFTNGLNCDAVNFSSFSDVNTWINDELLAKVIEVFYDERGHIYHIEDCDGNTIYDSPTEEPTELSLTSTLSEVAASRVVPEDVSSTFAFDFEYKIFNKGLNFTDYIASGKKLVLGVTNGLGEKVLYSYVAGGPYNPGILKPAENVGGTSGLDEDAYLSTNKFRFNDVFTLSAAVAGGALRKTATINSEAVTATLNTTTTIIRDHTDPNVAAFSVSVSYSVTNLGSATTPTISDTLTNGPYCTGLYFTYTDGKRASWSYQGANGPFSTDTRFLELDNTSATSPFSNIYFDLRDDVADDVDFDLAESGVVVNMCTELLSVGDLYNANVDKCDVLSVMSESDCIGDGTDDVTDESGECIEDEGTGEIPSAPCVSPGTGLIGWASSICNFYEAGLDNYSTAYGYMTDKNFGGFGSASAARVSNNVGAALVRLARCARRFDTTGKPAINGVAQDNELVGGVDVEWVAVYTTENISARSEVNKIWDMHTWTFIGKYNGNQDLDLSVLPEDTNCWVGVLSKNDYDGGDYSAFVGVTLETQGKIDNLYEC